jgi:hypothetical protein
MCLPSPAEWREEWDGAARTCNGASASCQKDSTRKGGRKIRGSGTNCDYSRRRELRGSASPQLPCWRSCDAPVTSRGQTRPAEHHSVTSHAHVHVVQSWAGPGTLVEAGVGGRQYNGPRHRPPLRQIIGKRGSGRRQARGGSARQPATWRTGHALASARPPMRRKTLKTPSRRGIDVVTGAVSPEGALQAAQPRGTL